MLRDQSIKHGDAQVESKPTHDMNSLAKIFGSKKRVYELANSGKLRLKKLGKLTIGTQEAVAECLEALPDYVPGASTLPNPKRKVA